MARGGESHGEARRGREETKAKGGSIRSKHRAPRVQIREEAIVVASANECVQRKGTSEWVPGEECARGDAAGGAKQFR